MELEDMKDKEKYKILFPYLSICVYTLTPVQMKKIVKEEKTIIYLINNYE